MNTLAKITSSQAPKSVLLIRLMVGAVFFFEGVQKFLYAADVGAGRFAKIGIPAPEIMGPFVGGVEVIFLIIVGAGALSLDALLACRNKAISKPT